MDKQEVQSPDEINARVYRDAAQSVGAWKLRSIGRDGLINSSAAVRAERVFECIQAAPENPTTSDALDWALRLQEVIYRELDPESLIVLLGLARKASALSWARARAYALHKENIELKAFAFKWLDENAHRYESLNKAAEALAAVVPMKPKTRRNWCTEWNKGRSKD